MTYETVIRGGLIATADTTFPAEIGITDGKIAAIEEHLDGDSLIDVTGCIVVPGGIDVHTHFDTNLGNARTADDYESGSRAAAFGGITTFVNYAFQGSGETLSGTVDREVAKAEGRSYLDHSFHPVITRVDQSVLDEFEALRDRGITSLKVFTGVPMFQLTDAEVLAVLDTAARTGVLVNVHAEDGPLIDYLTAKLLAAGETGPESLPRARPAVAEGLSVEKVSIYGAELGCPIYFVHMSSASGLDAARRARERGAEVYLETRPIYLHLDQQCYCLPQLEAQKFIVWPPLRTEDDKQALWEGLANGEIQTCATDHTTWMLAEKTGASLDFASVPGGASNVETMMGMLYSEGVRSARLTLGRFVEVTSTNPAKLFGMWPRKGTIAVGADADLAIIDPERHIKIAAARMQSASDYDPYESFEATGWPIMTILRGRVVVADGAIQVEPGQGELIKRGLLTRPTMPEADGSGLPTATV